MYNTDQAFKQRQQEAEVAHLQDRWEDGYDDALKHQWKGCKLKTEKCSRYCKYLAGYQWGLEQASIHYHAACASNLTTLDSEYSDEF